MRFDYTKPNFVHADLDAQTFQRLQEERGETFEMLFTQAIDEALTTPSTQPTADAQDTDKTLENW